MAPKFERKRPAAALSTVSVPCPTVPQNSGQKIDGQKERVPWNKGIKMGKSDLQHLFIPKEDYVLFLATAIYFAGPKYAMALWLTMATSRRISETLRLHGEDAYLEGGYHHDSPHILFQKRDAEQEFKGAGKLGGKHVVARLSPEACSTLKKVKLSNVEWKILPALEPFQKTHAQVFEEVNPLSTETFKWPSDEDYVFPCATKKAKQPWMARQSVSMAVGRILEVMHRLTGKRRWNKAFKGSHVTVHGATRHTAAALLLAPPEHGKTTPTEHVIMEIQQRHDIKTFRRHYCHAQEDEVAEALEHASVSVSFHSKEDSLTAVSEHDTQQQHDDPAPAVAATAMAPNRTETPEIKQQQPVHKSRNAWRQQKRREGKKAWKERSGGNSTPQPSQI